MEISQFQEEIIEEFSLFEDWMDKYNHLIELSKSLSPMQGKSLPDGMVSLFSEKVVKGVAIHITRIFAWSIQCSPPWFNGY